MKTYTFIKRRDGYEVLSDGESVGKVTTDTYLLRSWKDGMEAEEADMVEIIARDRADAALQSGLGCIARGDKSKCQVIEYLHKKEFDRKSIDYALMRLEEYGYVDDGKLASEFTASAIASGKGRFYIKNKLTQRGVERSVIEEAIEGIDPEAEYEAALALGQSLNRKTKETDKRKRLAKLSRGLVNAGFGWETVNEVLNALGGEKE